MTARTAADELRLIAEAADEVEARLGLTLAFVSLVLGFPDGRTLVFELPGEPQDARLRT